MLGVIFFSLTISEAINSRLLLVTVLLSKNLTLSGRYFFITLISSVIFLFLSADTGTISDQLYSSLYSKILLNISSLDSPSILLITKITGLPRGFLIFR